MPIPRSAGALVAVGDVLHYFGGFNIKGRTDSNLHYTLDLSEAKATIKELRAENSEQLRKLDNMEKLLGHVVPLKPND